MALQDSGNVICRAQIRWSMESYEKRHRRRKREWEMSLIMEAILKHLEERGYRGKRACRSLEFGCGDGFQIPYLEEISEVTAIDVRLSEEMRSRGLKNYFECSITDTPFASGVFDLIFSNHVIEHIEDLRSSFREMKRIGKNNAIYAFCVPTNIFLLLSIPAQYYNRVMGLMRKLSLLRRSNKSINTSTSEEREAKEQKKMDLCKDIFKNLHPTGHVPNKKFFDCYFSFRIKAWIRLFLRNGFSVIQLEPLLLYSASELPIIPTTRALTNRGFSSSYLFLMTKS